MQTKRFCAGIVILMFGVFLGCGGGGSSDSGGNGNPADTTAPVITLNGANPVTVAVGAAYVDAGATAVDDVDGDVSNRITISGLTINTSVAGSNTVTYSVSDKSGNHASANRMVNVVNNPPADTTAPVITLNGANPVTVTVGAAYVDAGATAVDDVDGDVSNRITISGLTINTSVAGSNTVTYSVSDKSGNHASANRMVNVTAATVLWKNPGGYVEGYDLLYVATDGSNAVIRSGDKADRSSTPFIYKALVICYNNDGTTRWTKEDLSGIYHKGIITNGNLYIPREVPVLEEHGLTVSQDYYIDRRSLTDGALIGNPLYVGNNLQDSSITFDSTGIFVSLVVNQTSSIVVKTDLALSSKSTLLTFDGAINFIDASNGILRVAGAVRIADPLGGGTSSFVLAYTTTGTPVWASPQIYSPQSGTFTFGNAVAFSGSYVYLTGYTIVLPPLTETYPPFLRKYNAADGSFISAVALPALQYGTAWEMVFGPTGNIYVATSSGTKGPVALDGSGNVLWTGVDQGVSLVYFQGKIITPASVYDAVTGQKLF